VSLLRLASSPEYRLCGRSLRRDAQRLILPDQLEQPLVPRGPRVDQLALQQHVVLRWPAGSPPPGNRAAARGGESVEVSGGVISGARERTDQQPVEEQFL
jgi:hypothetical protein